MSAQTTVPFRHQIPEIDAEFFVVKVKKKKQIRVSRAIVKYTLLAPDNKSFGRKPSTKEKKKIQDETNGKKSISSN